MVELASYLLVVKATSSSCWLLEVIKRCTISSTTQKSVCEICS
jgi:hypothetical protein